MINKKFILIAIVWSIGITNSAAQILTKSDALSILMDNNFDVKIAELNEQIAKNNTSFLNTGYLPTINATGNLNYNIDNSGIVFANGADTTINNAESDGRGINLNVNYILFNGFNRKHSIERNKENLTASQLSTQNAFENVLINFYNAYYDVARNQQTAKSLRQTLDISSDRLERTKLGFDFGRSSRLDVSNAEVDVNTDKINYLNSLQALENSIRQLNFILGEDAAREYTVEEDVIFVGFNDKNELKSLLASSNTQVQLAKSGVKVSQLDRRITNSNFLPTVSLNGGYNNSLNNFAPGNFLSNRTNSGITYGASFNWNIFDGGTTKVNSQNSRINIGIQETLYKQTLQQVDINFENTWSDYGNKVIVVQAQQDNLKTNQLNFERTKEQYKLGRVNSLDFRNAQRNLLVAEINLIQAKYDAKLAELLIFQLIGKLQDASF